LGKAPAAIDLKMGDQVSKESSEAGADEEEADFNISEEQPLLMAR